MDRSKTIDQQELSHAAAHHLVAIAELRDSHGYARVSDVARVLEITRGSASITLKSLKQKGYVEEDENRFLRLSSKGAQIADAVRAKRRVLRELLVSLLGVDAEQAEQDSCRIEHLISGHTAARATHVLRFLKSGRPEVKAFLRGLRAYESGCDRAPADCPCCTTECLEELCQT